MQKIERTINVNASSSKVWKVLTDIQLMKQWMAEPEMQLEIITDWIVGGNIIIQGFLQEKFENRGTVLRLDLEKLLNYNYLSSISHLPDLPENYSTVEFSLDFDGNRTSLTIRVENFPTESIFRHLEFYWLEVSEILREFIEDL